MTDDRQRRLREVMGVGVALIAAIAVGCGSDDDDGTAGGGEQPVELALLMADTSTTYQEAVIAGAEDEADKEGASLDVLSAQYDPQRQLTQCQDAIAQQKYDALLLKAVDGGAIVPCAKQAIEAGLKVVGADAPVGPSWETLEPQVDGLVGNLIPLAQTNGSRLAELTEMACEGLDPCDILYEIGNPAYAYDSSLLDQFKEDLAPNMRMAAQVQTNFNPDDGLKETANALQAHPEIDVIVTEDTTSRGTIPAVAEAGRQDDVTVVGDGGSKWAASQIKKGTMFGSVTTAPYTALQTATDMAIKAVRGEPLPEETFIDDFAEIEPPLLTKETVDQWEPQF